MKNLSKPHKHKNLHTVPTVSLLLQVTQTRLILVGRSRHPQDSQVRHKDLYIFSSGVWSATRVSYCGCRAQGWNTAKGTDDGEIETEKERKTKMIMRFCMEEGDRKEDII